MFTALLFAVSIHWGQLTLPTPAPPAAVPPPAAVTVQGSGVGASPAPARLEHSRPAPAPTRVAPPRVGPGSLDNSPAAGGTAGPAAGPVRPPAAPAPQLPTEVIGRQIDCPDGTVGTMAADGTVTCP